MSTSGEISLTTDSANVIQDRGGIDYFKRVLGIEKSQPHEMLRLQK
jgi:hypothetical protein